jgi:DNA (cytosine-5)-methyltransferase 1
MRLLDLFCCAGGASKGYVDAGFDVVGVDLKPQPRYPYKFIQADAIECIGNLIATGAVDDFDAIHASPPCQAFSKLSNSAPGTKERYPNLMPQTRELLRATNKPYVIENVPGAPLNATVILCGTSFSLRLRLHRLFETSFPVTQLACDHSSYVINPANADGRARIRTEFPGRLLEPFWRETKGVSWMNGHEGREAIPPVYTKYIGQHLLTSIGRQHANGAYY